MSDLISRQAVLDGLASIAKAKAKSDAQKSLMGRVMFFTEQLPSVNPQPCEDAISRQALLDAFGFSEKTRKWGGDHSGYNTMMLYEIQDMIESAPPVKPQEKTGRWITKIKSDLRGDMWPTNPRCSECGGEPYYSNTIYNYKYCPYCGAKMVEPQESEDKE